MSDQKQKVIEKLKNDPLMPLRHSAEHILHMSIESLFKGAKKVMGPPIEDGFYGDFDVATKISQEDFDRIETRMQEIIDSRLPIVLKEISADEAKQIFKDNPYKMEFVNEFADAEKTITVCEIGSDDSKFHDIDLCAGPHVGNTGDIKAFKLLSVAGAYWRGDEKNKMLTRIYATAFDSSDKLQEYLELQEEIKKRDHRKIGKDMELFTFSDLVGKGLPLFTEKGATVYRELSRFVVDEEIKRGYQHVITPPLAKTELYKTSGHYPYYKDTMYPPMIVDEDELILRPMACPHHFMLYKSRPHSYREMPVKYAELADYFRYEKSGELSGLMRVRMFCLADAHIFAMKDQSEQVIADVLDLIEYVNTVFGLKKGEDYRYRLSLGDRSDNNQKYYKDDAAWEYAENALRQLLTKRNEPFYEAEGEAAFYGPKIDVQVKKVGGHEETAFTVQYDFVMPQRFDLKYIDATGKEQQPVVIHRSSIGAMERTMAFLIEKYSGAMPVWLSPQQVAIIPIGENHIDYAKKVEQMFKEKGLRVQLDDRSEPMNARIRDAQNMRVPYMLIIGDREVQSETVSVRLRTEENLGAKPIAETLEKINNIYLTRSLDLW